MVGGTRVFCWGGGGRNLKRGAERLMFQASPGQSPGMGNRGAILKHFIKYVIIVLKL